VHTILDAALQFGGQVKTFCHPTLALTAVDDNRGIKGAVNSRFWRREIAFQLHRQVDPSISAPCMKMVWQYANSKGIEWM